MSMRQPEQTFIPAVMHLAVHDHIHLSAIKSHKTNNKKLVSPTTIIFVAKTSSGKTAGQ